VTKDAFTSHVGRRSFIKTTAIAGVAATIPGTALPGQNAAKPSEQKVNRGQKKLLCLSGSSTTHAQLIPSIKSIPGTSFLVKQFEVNFNKPEEVLRAVSGQDADILLLCLSGFTFNFGKLYDSMGDLNIPIIILASSPDMIMIDANFAASLRGNGANVSFAISEKQVLELLKNMASPRILEGKKALLFSPPFDSFTVPSHALTADLVYQRTGVKVQFRSLEELEELYKSVGDANAKSEMERWKKEATEIVKVPDKAILDACKLYILLRSLVDKEGLSAISLDCLRFTMGMGMKSTLPIPCLAFARLRDEGITAACEADVCGMISSMFLETVSRKPSFMANVVSVDLEKSNYVFSHCVSPLKLDGRKASPMKYRLHDYHNMGRGVVPEVEFPTGKEVIAGAFSKNLKSFILWPGRIQSQVKETELTSPSGGFGLNTCANSIEIKIKDAAHFLQNISSIHHVMVTGNYMKAVEEALAGMNVTLISPSDYSTPDA
jgi:hypothetical protein